MFGLADGPAPDRMLVGLAVLGLLAHAAQKEPLLCLVDDAQWLDTASAVVLAFVARRLDTEAVELVFASREVGPALRGLPQLRVAPLAPDEARRLLDRVVTAVIDEKVREQLVAETGGNPLQLVELPHEIARSGLAGGYALSTAFHLPQDVESRFRTRTQALPGDDRLFLVLAAAEPTGDAGLLRRAAATLGLPPTAGAAAVEAGLLERGVRVRFRHPIARTAAYRCGTLEQRHRAHAALFDATDPDLDPDRRAWHRALASDEPDEDVAAELERAADRAELRGGLSAAAAFLERSALLTPDAAHRSRRAVQAAQNTRRAGQPSAARDLLVLAASGPLTAADQVRADLIVAQLDVATSWGGDMPARLLDIADRLRPVNPPLSRMVHLEAIYAAAFAGRYADEGAALPNAVAAALTAFGVAAPRRSSTAGPRSPLDLLLHLLVSLDDDTVFPDRGLRRACLTALVALDSWDLEGWTRAVQQHLELCRQLGAATDLPIALASQVFTLLAAGETSRAGGALVELQAAAGSTGNPSVLAQHAELALTATRGQFDLLDDLVAEAVDQGQLRREGIGLSIAYWARAMAENSRGRYAAAAAAAAEAARSAHDVFGRNVALVEQVEALVRSGRAADARTALALLGETVPAHGSAWGRGVLARCEALVSDSDDAERLYRQSIELLDSAGARSALARTHLLHGEWLRRTRRRTDARAALRTAKELFDQMGMAAFADRAAGELWATGEIATRHTAARGPALTPQETRIAELAGEGLTNPEIGARLFLSARTVEYHLGKVFVKLGITARTQLEGLLP